MVKFLATRPRNPGSRFVSRPVRFGSQVAARRFSLRKQVMSAIKKRRVSSRGRGGSKIKFTHKQKKHTKNEVINSPAGTVSHSYTTFTPHKALLTAGEDKLLGVTSIAYNNGVRLDGTTGFQIISTGHSLLDSTAIGDIFTKMRLFDQNGVATTNYVTSSARMLVESVMEEQLFTNQGSNMIKLELFDCIARKDMVDSQILQPGFSVGLGLTTQTTAPTTAGLIADTRIYGCNPFQSETFTKNWKVVKVNTVYIPPGGNHTHKIHFHCNWDVRYEDFWMYLGGINYLGKRGKTIGTFHIMTGFPDNGATNKTDVTLGSCSLDMVYRQDYKCRAIQNNTNNYKWTNTIPSALTGVEEIENEYTMTAQTFNKA